MDIAKLALKFDVKIEFKYPIDDKLNMELPQLTEDFDPELFKGLSDAITKFLEKQYDDIPEYLKGIEFKKS